MHFGNEAITSLNFAIASSYLPALVASAPAAKAVLMPATRSASFLASSADMSPPGCSVKFTSFVSMPTRTSKVWLSLSLLARTLVRRPAGRPICRHSPLLSDFVSYLRFVSTASIVIFASLTGLF